MLFFTKTLKPFIGDVSLFVGKNLHKKSMLFEGAMATMLDGQFGTYPYTVANNTLAASIFVSLGIPETPLNVIGVIKAYTTRVGGGPFPTEQKNKTGARMQSVGREIAATSGRIRRCGWLDLNLVRYSQRLNNFSSLVLTKLDVLSAFSEILVCTDYKVDGKTIKEYPSITHQYDKCEPVYRKFKGWKKDISAVKQFKDLPKEAQIYVKFIEKELKIPVSYIFVGPERNQTIKK